MGMLGIFRGHVGGPCFRDIHWAHALGVVPGAALKCIRG